MKITIEEAKKIALLSRLEFSPEDLEKMRESMNSILTHMEELSQYDTTDVAPTVHAVEQTCMHSWSIRKYQLLN